jgi:S-(hydroxymethyl)glutathione dehydrogenase/alcohol dehydrogenase
MLRPGGSAVVVGVAPKGLEVGLPALEFLSEKTITGSYYGSTDVGRALTGIAQLLLAGRLEVDDVVSHVINLGDVQTALERLRRGEGARSVIVIDEQLSGGPPQWKTSTDGSAKDGAENPELTAAT